MVGTWSGAVSSSQDRIQVLPMWPWPDSEVSTYLTGRFPIEPSRRQKLPTEPQYIGQRLLTETKLDRRRHNQLRFIYCCAPIHSAHLHDSKHSDLAPATPGDPRCVEFHCGRTSEHHITAGHYNLNQPTIEARRPHQLHFAASSVLHRRSAGYHHILFGLRVFLVVVAFAMVYSLTYRRPPHVTSSSTNSLSGNEKQESINESVHSANSCMSHGIPTALSFDRIIAGGTCPVSFDIYLPMEPADQ